VTLVSISPGAPVARFDARLVDLAGLQRELNARIEGEVRFDPVTRALYANDASVYQIVPLGAVVVKTREDLISLVKICAQFHCPLTLRGGGTSQAGQAIGAGLVADTSKYYSRILELNVEEQWVRVEPGIVLDDLNAALRPHGLRFAPDISTASRATIGGMMANNSSGARSVYYGKTIDHVIDQEVVLADGSVVWFGPKTASELAAAMEGETLEAECYRTISRLASTSRDEVERRFPKILRRVGGYNLDEFVSPSRPFNLAKIMVGSEGTLGVVLQARLSLVRLPKEKAVLIVQFSNLLDSLGATPIILKHGPSAVEVMDAFILGHTCLSPNLQRMRETVIEGEPGALLCIEFYDEMKDNLPPRLAALEAELRSNGLGYRWFHALDPAQQARVWALREAALGLSMTMKEDAKSVSFVEDTAVAPENLRDFIERFQQIIQRHGTSAGVYAHASVGCLHVRPVVNLKTAEGVSRFESIANDVADLVLEFGGALSGEHGDGMVRGPFMRKMFGPVLYEAFCTIKRTFDPHGLFNPGKIVDCAPLTENLRFGAGYATPAPRTFFDFSEYGGMGGAVEMCSGIGACRRTLEGTMCPSYMATREETHVTRGRANVLRLAMTGRLEEAGLDDHGVFKALDLCLECRACKAECPVGVDMARFKSEFLAAHWQTHGTPLQARLLGNIHTIARLGSRIAPVMNRMMASNAARVLNESVFGIDRRRTLPPLSRNTLESRLGRTTDSASALLFDVLLFNDTFTNYYEPEIGVAAWEVMRAAGLKVGLAPNQCCGRPLISGGLLKEARELASRNTSLLAGIARSGRKLVFCEPGCLSAMREDAPSLLRGEEQKQARIVADACVLFEDFANSIPLWLSKGPSKILLHPHCHQKSMGLASVAKNLLEKIPGVAVGDLDAGCCGMAGSFGYSKDHFDISRQIGERKLFPQIRSMAAGSKVVTCGTSCRHQIHDFTGVTAVHPAILLRSLLK
jgi:FAD/FMN-containing dehydrogenase/Fe-S oxidoreductase